MRAALFIALFLASVRQLPAQTAIAAVTQPTVSLSSSEPQMRSTYLLGPDDQITIHALDAEEIGDKPFRIDQSGFVRLPLAGRLKAAGLTLEEFENEVAVLLKKYVKEPQVTASISEFRSQPVSIIGAVKNPGVHQLQGHKTLIEVLSLAGGLSDDAGYALKITRRLEWGRIPLPTAATDSSGNFSVAEVNIRGIMSAAVPEQNILILPEDVISVPRAEMVYVIGQVPKPGGYILGEHESFSVLKAVSLAGGIDHGAAPQNARILRPLQGSPNRAEIPINLKAIMSGTTGDVALKGDDILFVPVSAPKKAMARAAEAAIQLSTGIVLYRR